MKNAHIKQFRLGIISLSLLLFTSTISANPLETLLGILKAEQKEFIEILEDKKEEEAFPEHLIKIAEEKSEKFEYFHHMLSQPSGPLLKFLWQQDQENDTQHSTLKFIIASLFFEGLEDKIEKSPSIALQILTPMPGDFRFLLLAAKIFFEGDHLVDQELNASASLLLDAHKMIKEMKDGQMYDQVKVCFEQLMTYISSDPFRKYDLKNARAFYCIGQYLLDQGKASEAKEWFEKAAKEDPDAEEALANLALEEGGDDKSFEAFLRLSNMNRLSKDVYKKEKKRTNTEYLEIIGTLLGHTTQEQDEDLRKDIIRRQRRSRKSFGKMGAIRPNLNKSTSNPDIKKKRNAINLTPTISNKKLEIEKEEIQVVEEKE